mmetsp:Transcript_2038/g.9228  ORF Transcript_2038/g.9228 Transcript_2038/m.9228 type:complete len:253 (+) Transcript_2038:1176-1934(+)
MRHRVCVSLEVRCEALGEDLRFEGLEGTYGAREVFRAAVRYVVAVHGCEHDVSDAPLRDGLGGVFGFHLVGRGGCGGGVDRAEAASACARVAEDHDRRGSRVAVPALAEVRAHGFLAHGGEFEILQAAGEVLVAIAARGALAQPRGLGEARGLTRDVALHGVGAGDGWDDHRSAHRCRRVHRGGNVHAALLGQLDELRERVAGLLERFELVVFSLGERHAVLARGVDATGVASERTNPRHGCAFPQARIRKS